ncbi:GNAT family N-acetyltransferase [Glycomyces sp. TRM65418]|uniref:GNAT family N-acetyltransferase n=1 Tax=Glycomyces sp. TRM65418 TaxID=2867006 RepID=UPI001CE6B80E|nr:GNAT family N-acetyltransferase [Glycomyces sp. TRM65418]
MARLGDHHGEPDDLFAQVEHAEAVGVARAVADVGWTGVFAMAVLPEARGRGAGRALISVLAEWARAQGTPTTHLQVEADNEPASALYAKAGFTEALAYRCRSQR